MTDGILIGKDAEAAVRIWPRMANRHGLVAGATGTGKTVTLQRLAEQFSRRGVPVFLADVKGDLAGISQPGGDNAKVAERVSELQLDDSEFAYRPCPVTLWDLYGEQGHPVRTTISEMGPLLLARLLNLNDVQEGVLNICFRVADDNGLLLLDMKDLRAMLNYIAENAASLRTSFGNVSAASVGAIQRRLLQLEDQGGNLLFGEPALDLADLMQTDINGQGIINVLAADKLIHNRTLYATFLLWLLSELFEQLPEVGDPDQPKLVFFFDEAHLLFDDAPKVLTDKVEQVVRLIRSKGVGVYFVTQSPMDVPDDVLGQLGNRVQHALRAFTPRDQKAVRAAAQTFRINPALDTETAITALGVGEALASTLDLDGIPSIVERVKVAPPGSQLGPITATQRQALMQGSLVAGVYEKSLDRESAYEILKLMADQAAIAAESTPVTPAQQRTRTPSRGNRQTAVEAFASSAMRSLGTQIGRQIVRGVMGSLFGGTRRR
ncbi:MAG: helicase HerA-like domain-containing protein [Lamprobacter sp.]|uniref:helicase HerA-like domain-containing protein n=1 Tax=Lamprobacter sp. TaxID=3100796 RepID=UPI002B25DAF9|nr:helicase HerA-like domain-containing protein [Lamprobacter sp.]MEA3642554.1 helicase HerA-like domain-containing protein [Lamprobacter sp.]